MSTLVLLNFSFSLETKIACIPMLSVQPHSGVQPWPVSPWSVLGGEVVHTQTDASAS